MDEAVSSATGDPARAILLAEPTCNALGLPPSQPTARRDVAAGALGLLDPAPVSELAESLTESLDELIVGVVEAVEECVLTPPPDCADPRLRAELEAVSWVNDFIADDAPHDEAVVAQHAMFQLACLVADAVADALTAHILPSDGQRDSRCLGLGGFDVRRVANELHRRGVDAVRWSSQLAAPLKFLHR